MQEEQVERAVHRRQGGTQEAQVVFDWNVAGGQD